MNMPSIYQDGLFNALAASGEIDLRVIFARELTPDRVQLGWEQEDRIYSNRTLSRRNRLLDAIRIARSELHENAATAGGAGQYRKISERDQRSGLAAGHVDRAPGRAAGPADDEMPSHLRCRPC